ncbi:MAG: hypothetical protein H0T73_19175 [Ardenticatenales bacterium]|nr:hypothetical protein [Ardenticatenales bacterium]
MVPDQTLSAPWGLGATYAEAMGEGSPAQWQALGLEPLPTAWQESLGSLSQASIGITRPCSPVAVRRVLGGTCIHRSEGVFLQLPYSVLWEVLTVCMFAKQFRSPAVILLPIAEESCWHADLLPQYQEMGLQFQEALPRFGEQLGVELSGHWQEQCGTVDTIEQAGLYGLFAPFSDDPKRLSYPFGETDEALILKVYESYCSLYAMPRMGIQPGDLFVEGIHLARSVLLGLSNRATYVATVPLPSPHDPQQFLIDLPHVPRLAEPYLFPTHWWVNALLQCSFGLTLNALRDAFLDGLAGC